jgi:pimeloyl-ACP methyl ester carboxylesterase
MGVREESMLAIYEKRSLSLIRNMVFCRRFFIALALLCVLPIATLGQTAATAQNSPAPLGKLIDVGGYRVHLYCIGAGSPAVVIVGAGYSFDWGLVQPEVAKFTQVCSYDHSGIGWSESGPKDSCSLRVGEVHTALKNAEIKGPYVLVGHSLGGLVARVYAGRYPDEVTGMVFVDHAFSSILRSTLSGAAKAPPPSVSPAAPMLLNSGGALAIGLEDDPNFSKLPQRDRELHLWAVAQIRDKAALQSNHEVSMECAPQADAIAKEQTQPLGDKPLVDVSTDMMRSPEYVKLQTDLLSLSRNSKEMIAEKSGHFVIIDRPDVVIDAISLVVQSVRKNAKL